MGWGETQDREGGCSVQLGKRELLLHLFQAAEGLERIKEMRGVGIKAQGAGLDQEGNRGSLGVNAKSKVFAPNAGSDPHPTEGATTPQGPAKEIGDT